ncbi:hypothetical protein ACFE04_020287 [Oxalis oulophora]
MEEEILPSSIQPDSPPPKKAAGGWKSIRYILGNETFEKLASMSLIANIAVYLRTKYNVDGIMLVTTVSVWSGSSSLTPIAGAIISDVWLGRFKTLLYGCVFSLLGMATLTLTAAIPELRPPTCVDQSSCQEPTKFQLSILYLALSLIAIGAGGIRPCNIAFGADQFDTTTKKGREQLESFFNWWYFTFTVALLVALTAVVYIQTNISWVWGFAIPTLCLVLSITIFLIGKSTYIIVKPQGSIFVDLAKVVTAASWKRRVNVHLASEENIYNPITTNSQALMLDRTNKFSYLDKAAVITDPSEIDNVGKPKNGWRLCSLQKVEQLKLLLGMLPVWLTGIGCFIVMDQQNTLGILQAIQMNRKIGSDFNIPPGWLGMASMIALSIWILTYERVYLPLTRRNGDKEKRLTMRQRINIGIVMSIIGPLVSAIVEKKRRESALALGRFESPMSVLLLLPQFGLSGLIEGFAAVAIMEFLTMQLPESMRTVSGAIFFLSLSIASYLNSILVNVIFLITSKLEKTPWLGGKDLNKDKLEYFYMLVAGISVMNLFYFNIFAKHFVMNNIPVKDDELIEKMEEGTTTVEGVDDNK